MIMGAAAPITRHGIHLPADTIADLCRKYGVVELSIYGSFLRSDFRPDSDIDFLAVFADDDYGPWMGKLTRLESELSSLLDRKVEVVPKPMLKWVIRNRVLDEAQYVYVAENR
jgi:uncharacterized protein